MNEKSKFLVYNSLVMFRELVFIQRRHIEKEKVMLEKGSNLIEKLCKSKGVVHWVRGAAHREGMVHWVDLHSVKNTLARHI